MRGGWSTGGSGVRGGLEYLRGGWGTWESEVGVLGGLRTANQLLNICLDAALLATSENGVSG